ncbi:MAG TPA: class I SAM-dependent methyltransferase, partial [Flavisolibacter sp.]|nr:class I SAM-dependent methyltransferase [Flavisolibacter sp.]
QDMNTQQAYDSWASQYDTNHNLTRDLEARALRETLSGISFQHCLEIGCGTGKNTVWLAQKAESVTAVDLSEEMLAHARRKLGEGKVRFQQADITAGWPFEKEQYDLVSFSLVLEHIRDLDDIFAKAAGSLRSGGALYAGELHPFKQYGGSKARFETEHGTQVVECFTHHISEFTGAAMKHGLSLSCLNEYFDDDDRETGIPRILALLFRKS